ncbi:DNA recombination protein RmuC [Candidatus Roizmanbacteria bacterium CG03_land_8_20_14_0_80_39_12]|uniref:DNA recombination protein RmuC n=3 Tax=Candidatus Roizmaniibacteriota TaxID=1752723 RepID=A0A2M7BRC9_9BACT|nr:MAG: DNA recombination protein RmuC [Candidatus Roizmanbacteria bacterium CG03_land_8_20_14_0_80_39_12]
MLYLIILLVVLDLGIIFLLSRKRADSSGEIKDKLIELSVELRHMKDEFPKNREENSKNLHQTREELAHSLQVFGEQLKYLSTVTTQSLDKMTKTIENRLKQIQDDTNVKLEKMRETVDEKLQNTLNKRLSESFRTVQTQLDQVHKGLGEMRNLAIGVGDLKKVLTNVKTRGVMGEIQLANIIEDILTPDQYEKNVKTKKDSNDLVEFAIKLPGDESGPVYLPVDSKFPTENYIALINAYEVGDALQITEFSKKLQDDIESFAKDIHDKYIDVPYTTEFAILFLPTEGLYAEIIRKTDLIQKLQNKYHVNVAGPSTLASSLSGFRMGFRTLMIEKQSSKVWKVLGEVKTEFKNFESVLENAQKKIRQADSDLDQLVGTRTKQMQRKLREVEELPSGESPLLFGSQTLNHSQPTEKE